MTATNFRDLLAEAVARSFYVMQGGLDEETQPVVPNTVDHQVAHNLLARPVPWVDCPTCKGEGVEFAGDEDDIGDGCPTCSGTGKATVAQLLAWGSAVAEPIESPRFPGDDKYDDVVWYHNRILDVQP